MEKPNVFNAIECEGCNVPKGWVSRNDICVGSSVVPIVHVAVKNKYFFVYFDFT